MILRRNVDYVSHSPKGIWALIRLEHGRRNLGMLTAVGIVPGTIVESHRDADKEEDKLLSESTGTNYIFHFLTDLVRCVLLYRP